MEKMLAVVAALLIMLLILSFAKDVIIKVSVEKAMGIVTGLRLDMQSFRIGIADSVVRIKHLRLFNPRGCPDKVMLDMPEIFVDYNLPAMLKGRTHLEEVRINMKEFVVVKNKDGGLNLDSLKILQAQKKGKRPKEKKKAPQLQIDSLELKVGRVIYKDYSKGTPPLVREYDINLNERYKNVSDPYSLASLIVVSTLIKTNIPRLTDFNLNDLERAISGTLAAAEKVAAKTTVKAEKAIRETTQKAQEAVEETAQTLKNTTEELKQKLKLPFSVD